ncbi:MAG: ABC transporter ATP-binding protein [Chitinophagales bacterium]
MAIWDGLSTRQKKNQKTNFKETFQALKYLPPFFKLIWQTSKGLTIGNIVLRVSQAVFPLAMLFVGKLIIDEIILQIAADEKSFVYLWQLVAIEFGLAILSSLFTRVINLLDALLGDLFSIKTSEQLIEKAATLDLRQFEDANFYDKLERARRQTTNRVVLMSQVLTQMQEIITVGFLAAGLVYFEPWLILLLIIAVLPTFLSETYFNQSGYSLVRSWTPERRELDYLRFIGASDETAKEIKIFGLADFIKERFSTLSQKYYQANKSLAIKRSLWGSVFNTLGDVAYYGTYVFIIIRTVAGVLSVGDLTFLSGSFNRLRNLLQSILTRFSSITESALYLQDYFDFMEMEPLIKSDADALAIPSQIKTGFQFENVGFKYPGTEKWAVRNLSFELKEGEKLALVGENGAGKTTLVKLLARLYDPSEGRILLDGIDLKAYDLIELRKTIGVIFQDFVKFYFKASENIAIGSINERGEMGKILEAAEDSLADSVIEKLPKKYDQMLGRRFADGVDLSGGEWQKVALARAYMRDAKLLILDEPTAALDARAEFEAFQRFAELTKGKTAVLISHRFSTVRMADRILVLKNGQKEEIGSHEELLKSNGLYAELFNLQAKGYQ